MTELPHSGKQENCTGCSACAAICPESCIRMRSNNEGFLYPHIDTGICTDCGICRQICPVNSQSVFEDRKDVTSQQSEALAVYAAWHLDENIRHQSSSGGVFTAIAERILVQRGAVVGSALDDHLVARHILIESLDGLHSLRGSKYVQSEVPSELYHQIAGILKDGRPVLFSGTPCQVAGIRSFFSHSYEKLFCCDLICHGVPSPLFFEHYVRNISSRKKPLATVDFRDKTNGWKNYGVRKHYKNGSSKYTSRWVDPYMLAFLKNYSLRPSCYACNFKGIHRFGDLTMADFWGAGKKYPEYDLDDKGTSLILANNEKGMAWINSCRASLYLGPAETADAIANTMLVRSCSRPPQREHFYADLNRLAFIVLIRKYNLQRRLFRRVVSSFKMRFIALWWSVVGKLGFTRRKQV